MKFDMVRRNFRDSAGAPVPVEFHIMEATIQGIECRKMECFAKVRGQWHDAVPMDKFEDDPDRIGRVVLLEESSTILTRVIE